MMVREEGAPIPPPATHRAVVALRHPGYTLGPGHALLAFLDPGIPP